MEILTRLSWNEIKELKEYIKNYKLLFKDTIQAPGKLKFGCEIEFNSLKDVNYYRKKIKNKAYDVKKDGSGVDIIEITSPILNNTKEDWISMKKTLEQIKHGMISPNVGAHIHFDSSILKDSNILSFLKLWTVFEDIIYEFSTGEFEHLRKSADTYARQISEDVQKHIEAYEQKKTNFNTFSRYGKSYGINLANHLNYRAVPGVFIDTYEVRVPNGSLNINIWQNNVEFFSAFFAFANDPLNEIIINDMYKLGKLQCDTLNTLMLSDLIFNNFDSKVRFLNQFELNKQYNGFPKKKGLFRR